MSDNSCSAASCVLLFEDVTGAAGHHGSELSPLKRRPSLLKAKTKLGKLFNVIGGKLHESISVDPVVSLESSNCRMYYYDF